jgi:hypothetical protein
VDNGNRAPDKIEVEARTRVASYKTHTNKDTAQAWGRCTHDVAAAAEMVEDGLASNVTGVAELSRQFEWRVDRPKDRSKMDMAGTSIPQWAS